MVKNIQSETVPVGTRLTLEELTQLDAAAAAAGLNRAAFIKRAIKGRVIKFRPAEFLLGEAVSLFCTMRISVELDRPLGLDSAMDRLEKILDRLGALSDAEHLR